MKQITIYLTVMGILLLGALAAGVYVWYTIQTMNRDLDSVYQVLEERVEKQKLQADSSERDEIAPTNEIESLPVVEVVATATLPLGVELLTDEQRGRLENLSTAGEPIVITPTLIACATAAVGESRLNEIVAGSAPSPFELTALLPCLKK